MLATLTELRTYRVKGTDGDIGRIADLAFPQNEWIVRYVVVDMEEWSRQALLISAALGRLSRARHTLSADVQREQVANSPPVDLSQPIDRHLQEQLDELYSIAPYPWEEEHDIEPIGGLWGEEEPEVTENPDDREFQGPQLLFAGDLMDVYAIHMQEGEIGTLRDIIVQDETWTIPYVLIDTMPEARRVVIPTDAIQTIDLAARSIHVLLSVDEIAESPMFQSEEPITAAFEKSLQEYYDRYVR